MNDRCLTKVVRCVNGEDAPAQRLNRADWLAKALAVMISSGVDAVRITRLADMLGVTRGSFYWHFRDRAEVLDDILELWNRKNTASVLNAVKEGVELDDTVLSLFEVWLDPHLFDPELDFAIRAWARGDERILHLVKSADEQRLHALKSVFERHGFHQDAAETRARNFYYTQMGYYALEVSEPMGKRLALFPSYFTTYTGRVLTPEKVAEFQERIYAKSRT